MGRPTIAGDSPVDENRISLVRIQSTAGHEEPGGKLGGPPSNPKYYLMTDRGAVPGGKGEKDPGRGVNKNLKPCAYKHSKHVNV